MTTPKTDQLGNCPDCGLNMDFVGKAHRCRPSVRAVVVPALVSAPRVNNVNKVNKNADYQAKWRKANAALNQLRAREGMRKLRATPPAQGNESSPK